MALEGFTKVNCTVLESTQEHNVDCTPENENNWEHGQVDVALILPKSVAELNLRSKNEPLSEKTAEKDSGAGSGAYRLTTFTTTGLAGKYSQPPGPDTLRLTVTVRTMSIGPEREN